MTHLLLRIAIAAILSLSSFLVIIFRVSPLTAPGVALPFFFITLFLTIASFATLLFYGVWAAVPVEGYDAGRKMSLALREGIFLGLVGVLLLVFQILGILTWWIGGLIIAVFVLVELALHS